MRRPDLAERMGRVPTWVWFALALLLQVAIIGQMVFTHYTTTSTGRPVVLKIAPVDPRDPLRGDYLTFRYDISTLRRDLFMDQRSGSAWTPAKGETVYVPLNRVDAYWVANTGVVKALPSRAQREIESGGTYSADTVFLRGAVTDVGPAEVRVTYGIEEYFVPEGKGATFPLNRQASALVVIGSDGNGLVRQVFVGGQKWP